MARGSLHRADFSHRTYWKYWPFWSRTEIRSGDRNPENLDWIGYYPNLEEVYLTAGGDNCNYFSQQDLCELQAIEKLRVLHLTGVSISSFETFPKFPNVEEIRFTESGFPHPLSKQDLVALKRALPKIRKFDLEAECRDYQRVIYNPETQLFEYVPPRDDI